MAYKVRTEIVNLYQSIEAQNPQSSSGEAIMLGKGESRSSQEDVKRRIPG